MDTALRCAFPMWILELRERDFDYWQTRANICSQVVAEKGDVLMYGTKKKGAAADVFNRLAEGMAVLCLITRHPVPFGKMVFHHTGEVEICDSETEANERVWPSVPQVQSANSRSP